MLAGSGEAGRAVGLGRAPSEAGARPSAERGRCGRGCRREEQRGREAARLGAVR